MPIYEYRAIDPGKCNRCSAGFDVLQSLSDAALVVCDICEQPVRRIISAPYVGKADNTLDRSNLEKHGFTQYRKAEKGVYEKTAGKGPDTLKDN